MAAGANKHCYLVQPEKLLNFVKFLNKQGRLGRIEKLTDMNRTVTTCCGLLFQKRNVQCCKGQWLILQCILPYAALRSKLEIHLILYKQELSGKCLLSGFTKQL